MKKSNYIKPAITVSNLMPGRPLATVSPTKQVERTQTFKQSLSRESNSLLWDDNEDLEEPFDDFGVF